MVGAFESENPWLSRREQRRTQGDLDRVFACDAELRRLRQPPAERRGHLGLREVAERMDDALLLPGLKDPRVPVAEHGNAEARRQVEVLAAAVVDDAAALGICPDQEAEPLRRGTKRPSVSAAM